MNKLSTEKRAQVIGCLVEGMSIRATVRITGAAKNTVTKLLTEVGEACRNYQDRVFKNLQTDIGHISRLSRMSLAAILIMLPISLIPPSENG